MATTVRVPSPSNTAAPPPRLPALLAGAGLGGFLDGIVMHQILQWDHLLTDTDEHPMTTVGGLEDDTLASSRA